jgi:hypothetical protein
VGNLAERAIHEVISAHLQQAEGVPGIEIQQSHRQPELIIEITGSSMQTVKVLQDRRDMVRVWFTVVR